jgi:Skp family chaperone for outer membrane proteins
MKARELETILQRMLNNNIAITARSVVREKDSPFKHASDITRQSERKALLNQYQARQSELRALVEKTDKQSRTNLQARVARLTQEIEILQAERDLLIASHKAMLLAVGEMCSGQAIPDSGLRFSSATAGGSPSLN